MELLQETENRKDLSTSTSTLEDPQEKMMRQAQGKNPTRQSTQSVSRSTMSLEIVGGVGGGGVKVSVHIRLDRYRF